MRLSFPGGRDAKFAEHGVTRVDLPTMLRESDVVSQHVVPTGRA